MKLYWRPVDRRPPEEDQTRAGVGFVDVLFAIVVGRILELSVDGPLPPAGKAQLILAAMVTVSSWVGYHNSLNRTRYFLRPFWNLPFFQFVLDVLLVYTYWLLAVYAERAGRRIAPSAVPEAWIVAAIFAMYVAWDEISLVIRKSPAYLARPAHRDVPARRAASAWSLILAFDAAVIVSSMPPASEVGVIVVDALLALLVIGYRVAKEIVTPPALPNGAEDQSDGPLLE